MSYETTTGVMSTPRKLWLCYIEPHPTRAIELWHYRWFELDAADAGGLGTSFLRLGAKVFFAESEREILSKLDDARQQCSSCGKGTGRYRCPTCDSEVLTGALVMSVTNPKRAA